MSYELNRYYKDDKVGFRFFDTQHLLSDIAISTGIENFLGETVGNQNLECWLGTPICDTNSKWFYVFGHNRMVAQESRSSRLSQLFTFIIFPFSELGYNVTCKGAISFISQAENQASFASLQSDAPLSVETPSNSAYATELDYSLARFAVDSMRGFTVTASKEECSTAIDYLWSHAIFPSLTNGIVLTVGKTANISNRYWCFFAVSAGFSLNLPEVGSNLPPEQNYKFRAIYEASHQRLSGVIRSYWSSAQGQSTLEKFGRKNGALFPQLQLWYYAISNNNAHALLPTSAEKQRIIQLLK